MTALSSIARASLLLSLGLLIAGVGACRGTITFGGTLWPDDDDDSASDDDDATANDDDATADDDDATADDDDSTIGDDDDATGPGGPVFCGPEVSPSADQAGQALTVYTGDADVQFDHDARGGFFAAQWNGCEAKHFFDTDGEYVCGIKWTVAGPSYGEQYQTTRLVSRFTMDWTVADNTCAPTDPAVFRPDNYYRITVPYESGSLDVLVSANESTVPSQMDDWASVPWDGDGEDEPEEAQFEYATEFKAQ